MPRHDNLYDHRAWLFKARGNLSSAKQLAENNDELLDHAIYHTQQCAELALKAFLAFKDISIQKTHDLDKLLKQCMDIDATFGVLKPKVITLTPYVAKFRYPDDYLVPDREDVMIAIDYAEEVLTLVRKRIEYLSHPNMRLFE